MRVPLHINPNDVSPEADAKRYDLHAEAMRLNPSGWRTVGKKGGVTKPKRRNRLTDIAANAYGTKP